MLFSDRHFRKAFSDWEATCWDVTSYLRVQSGDHPQDGRLGSLVAELSLGSTVFDDMWTSRRVKDEYTPTCILLHPVIGRVELLHVPLVTMNGSEQVLATFFAAPGTPSAAAIARLAAGPDATARGGPT